LVNVFLYAFINVEDHFFGAQGAFTIKL